MKKLYLYGSGNRCRILLDLLTDSDYRICGIVDSNRSRWGETVGGICIGSPDELLNAGQDSYVCVTFYSSLPVEPVWKKLEEQYGITSDRQLSFHDVIFDMYTGKNLTDNVIIKGTAYKDRHIFLDASWGLGLGGVESWIRDIAGYFDEYGIHNYAILTNPDAGNIDENTKSHCVSFYYERTMDFSLEYINKGIEFICENIPATYIFSRVNELMLAACIVKMKYPDRLTIIMADHGSTDGMYRDILSYKDAIDKYVCVSNGIRQRLNEYGISPEKTYVMTAPIKYQHSLDRTYSLNMDRPISIGYAGRLEKFEKRMDILIQLIKELESRHVNYVMDIAGEGTYRQNIVDVIGNMGLHDKVRLVGVIPRYNMNEFWQKHDIAINVSDNEGRPIANMEAMLNGAVPVVTKTVGILDDVIDGQNGFVVPICDYKCMADRIQKLDNCRDELEIMGKKARAEMISKMSTDDYICLWKKVMYQ